MGKSQHFGKDMIDKMEDNEKFSLRNRVLQRLREDIITGKFQQGEELRETAVGEAYGVSRTPVREALRQLELEGLITVIPNKGACVEGVSAKDVLDIYEIRSRLEGLCARWATQNISGEQMDRMDEAVYMAEFHYRRSHFDKMAEIDSSFHEIMYEASGSRRLQHILSDFHQYIYPVRKMSMAANNRGQASIGEHRQIVEAIRGGNEDLAEQLLSKHILNAKQNALDNGLRDMLKQ